MMHTELLYRTARIQQYRTLNMIQLTLNRRVTQIFNNKTQISGAGDRTAPSDVRFYGSGNGSNTSSPAPTPS